MTSMFIVIGNSGTSSSDDKALLDKISEVDVNVRTKPRHPGQYRAGVALLYETERGLI